MASTSSEPTGKLHDFVVGAFGHGDEVPLADLLARCSHLDAYKQFETEVQELERASSSGKRPADDMNRRRTRLRMRMWRALRSPAAPMVSDGLPEPTEPSAAAPPAPPPAAPSSTLRQGMRVRIIGLTEAADLGSMNLSTALLLVSARGMRSAVAGRWRTARARCCSARSSCGQSRTRNRPWRAPQRSHNFGRRSSWQKRSVGRRLHRQRRPQQRPVRWWMQRLQRRATRQSKRRWRRTQFRSCSMVSWYL